MTRLASRDIDHICETLCAYDQELISKLGLTLRGLACNASGVDESVATERLHRHRAKIVPVDWGIGMIPGFTAAVAAILNHIGLAASITREANLSGFVEAVESQCDLIFISDDDDFVSFALNRKGCVHNAAATGRGFAAGLDLMAEGIGGRDALVAGCGPVGVSAAVELMHRGARVCIYDLDPARHGSLPDGINESVTVEPDLEHALSRHSLIVDATPAADLITAEMVCPQTIVAAPGMPLGLTAAALEKIGPRLLHDPLQIGVATMAVEALARKPLAASGGKP